MSAQIIPLMTRPQPRHLSSLSDQDCFTIAAALRLLPGSWTAERDETPEGEVVMALFAHEEEIRPAFLVRRDATGLRLEKGLSARPLGRFGNARELMCAARRVLDN